MMAKTLVVCFKGLNLCFLPNSVVPEIIIVFQKIVKGTIHQQYQVGEPVYIENRWSQTDEGGVVFESFPKDTT